MASVAKTVFFVTEFSLLSPFLLVIYFKGYAMSLTSTGSSICTGPHVGRVDFHGGEVIPTVDQRVWGHHTMVYVTILCFYSFHLNEDLRLGARSKATSYLNLQREISCK